MSETSMINYWKAKYALYVYGRVSSLRSLGINASYPEGAKTFREFLKIIKKKNEKLEVSKNGCP